jgi:hypothetical protein
MNFGRGNLERDNVQMSHLREATHRVVILRTALCVSINTFSCVGIQLLKE